MNIDRRDFIKYGVIGMGATAILGPGAAVASSQAARKVDWGRGSSMKPSGKEARIADHPLSWWVNKFQLPLHIYSGSVIGENVKAFRQVFQNLYPQGHIRFAAKACAHPAVFKIISREGAGIDVASYYEAQCALASGVPPEKLDLNGNCKEDFLIAKAIETDMLIVADSIEEFQIISRIAGRMGRRPRVVMRLSGFELGHVTAEAIFTAGKWTKFGADVDDIPAFLKTLDSYSSVRLLGFHTHIGSQIADLEPYLAVLGKMIELGHLLKKTGRNCEIINIGGGYPISYVNKEEWERFLERIREGYLAARSGDPSRIFIWHNRTRGFETEPDGRLATSHWNDEKFYSPYPKEKMVEAVLRGKVKVYGEEVNTVAALRALGEPALVIEPGRSLVGDSAITLARVSQVRKIGGSHNLMTLEMGVTSLGTALVYMPVHRWEIINDYDRKDPEPFETFVGGNLCFSGDMLAKYKIALQRKPVRGDIVLIRDTGSYGPQFFASNANAFPRPARVLVDATGKLTVMRKRDTYEDIFSV
ncbi:MAG: Diaminopimelate decarboxylase [Smithella sp. PtaU1.Bin162]|nr:MAG: Diaminopimelate decarboxylase [Smithella sp. PtaU1.Bin162]